MDCGVYPGMGSALIMDRTMQLDKIESIITFVGGLPEVREWPSEYKAVFSPIDLKRYFSNEQSCRHTGQFHPSDRHLSEPCSGCFFLDSVGAFSVYGNFGDFFLFFFQTAT